jgi:hypothetical protein
MKSFTVSAREPILRRVFHLRFTFSQAFDALTLSLVNENQFAADLASALSLVCDGSLNLPHRAMPRPTNAESERRRRRRKSDEQHLCNNLMQTQNLYIRTTTYADGAEIPEMSPDVA